MGSTIKDERATAISEFHAMRYDHAKNFTHPLKSHVIDTCSRTCYNGLMCFCDKSYSYVYLQNGKDISLLAIL